MDVLQLAPDVGVIPRAAQLATAVALQTALATSELRLFKDGEITVSETTTLAELDALQADFAGYTAGGVEITAFNDPYDGGAGGGYILVSPLVQFNWTAGGANTQNAIKGAYLVDSTGVLRWAVQFDDLVFMHDAEDSLPIVVGIRVK